MEDQKQLVAFIIITFIAILSPAMVVAFLISLHRRKMREKEAKIRQMAQEKEIENYKIIVDTEEKEREKIAKNLHDGILPTLSVIKSSLDMNAVDYANGKFNIERMERDVRMLEQSIAEIRGLSHDLVPPALVLNGVVSVLERYLKIASDGKSSQIHFEDRTTFADDLPFPITEQHNIYRICLELLNNLQKHSDFSILHVIVSNDDSKFTIEFVHNGRGVDNDDIKNFTESSAGLGLKSINSRVQILGAELDYSYDSQTAGIVLTVPFQNSVVKQNQLDNQKRL